MSAEERASDERTPLIGHGHANGNDQGQGNGLGNPIDNGTSPKSARTPVASAKTAAASIVFGPANRILLAGFLMAFTLGITQVPYVSVSL